MQLNKKILAIALMMSLHGTIMNMEAPSKKNTHKKKTRTPIAKNQFEELNRYTEQIKHEAIEKGNMIGRLASSGKKDPETIKALGKWLTEYRKELPDQQWNSLISKLSWNISGHACRCICPKFKRVTAIEEAIKKIAYALKPGDDCTQLLVNRIDTIIKNNKSEDDSSSEEDSSSGSTTDESCLMHGCLLQ